MKEKKGFSPRHPLSATCVQTVSTFWHPLQTGLAHHNNYHEFCRLLGRLKTNYQLSELVRRWESHAVHYLTITSEAMLCVPA